MRKLLLSIILIAFIIITALVMKDGISVGSLQVLGFQGLADANEELTELIGSANTKKNEYQQALDKMQADASSLARAKKAYLDLVTVSTDSDIQAALQSKTYTIEFLWSRIGNYATKEGVIVKMEVASSNLDTVDYKNLNFTVTGSYLSIINFIADIENDSKLEFTIDNFDMTKDKATFTIKDVKIQNEKTSTTIDTAVPTTDATRANNTVNAQQNTTVENNNNNNNTVNETNNNT